MNKTQFTNRWSNMKLPQQELDRKWRLQLEAQEQEHMMAEQAAYLQSLSTSTQGGASGGNLGAVESILTLTVDSTEYLYTTWCVTSSAPTTFTVDWGDGNIDEYNANGNECFVHEYEEIGIWNVVITFANLELITELEFND